MRKGTVLVMVAVLGVGIGHAALENQAPNLADPAITATRAIVVDPLFGADDEVYGLMEDQPAGILSITKLMNLRMGLKAMQDGFVDFSDCIDVTEALQNKPNNVLDPPLVMGDEVRFKFLLQAMMKSSSNPAAYASAKHVSDSKMGPLEFPDGYILAENVEASMIGLSSGTIYCGFVGAAQSTPRDQVKLWIDTAQMPHFWEIASTGTYEDFACNSLKKFSTTMPENYAGMDGSKGGFHPTDTNNFGCGNQIPGFTALIAQATRLGRSVVIMEQQTQNRWGDATNLFDYGFGKIFTPELRGNSGVQGGAVVAHALDCTGGPIAVTAGLKNNKKVEVCSWETVSGTGQVTRLGCSTGKFGPGKIAGSGGPGDDPGDFGGGSGGGDKPKFKDEDAEPADVEIAWLGSSPFVNTPPKFVVTALRKGFSTELTSWALVGGDFEPSELNSASLGNGVDVALHPLEPRFFLAAKRIDGRLNLSSWFLDLQGDFHLLDNRSVGGVDPNVKEYAIAHAVPGTLGNPNQYLVVTPVVTAQGTLRLVSWGVSNVTGEITGLEITADVIPSPEADPFQASDPAITRTDSGVWVAGFRDGGAGLNATFWNVTDTGGFTFRGSGLTGAPGTIGGLRIASLADDGFLGAYPDSNAALRLETWWFRQDPNPPFQTQTFNISDSVNDDLLGLAPAADPGVELCSIPAFDAAEAEYVTSTIDGGVLQLNLWRVGPQP